MTWATDGHRRPPRRWSTEVFLNVYRALQSCTFSLWIKSLYKIMNQKKCIFMRFHFLMHFHVFIWNAFSSPGARERVRTASCPADRSQDRRGRDLLPGAVSGGRAPHTPGDLAERWVLSIYLFIYFHFMFTSLDIQIKYLSTRLYTI